MARLIKMTNEAILNVTVQTLFEDGSITERNLGIGDVVENLRFVKDGELVTVSGKVTNINYTLPSRISFNKNKPTDTFSTDVTVSTIEIDASEQYASNIIVVPAIEIVEDEGVENVERIKFFATLEFKMNMFYSNRSSVELSLKVGDRVDGVKIMTSTPGVDIIGTFDVIAFSYVRNNVSKFTVNGIAFKNVEDGTIVVADLDKILELAELMTYEPTSAADMVSMLLDARDGEVVKLASNIDATEDLVTVESKDVTLNLAGKTFTVNSSATTGLAVKNGGTLTIDGDGTILNQTNYDSTHGSGSISVEDGGTLNFNNGTINAVLENSVDNGQFGIKAIGTSNVNINGGEINTGWYGVSTVGDKTNDDTVVTINGGKLTSASDYAVYIPKGNLVVNGGELIGAAGCISCNGGNITINDGILNCIGGGDTGSWENGTGDQSNSTINLNGKYSAVTCTINGGTFISSGDSDLIIAGTKFPVTISIKGGQFSKPVNPEYVAEGFVCTETKNSAGYYEVVAA